MSVYLPPDCVTWRYRFCFKGQPYAGTTGQPTKKAAETWETAYRKDLRTKYEEAQLRRASGIEVLTPDDAPRLADWATVYRAHVDQLVAKGLITRPDRIEDLLRVVLRFWGEKPSPRNVTNPPKDGEPYHDLRLLDPIQQPKWIVDFEDWMDARGVAGQTKNQYRSLMRQMYRLARQPRWRLKTGVHANPFDDIYRDRPGEREVTVTPEQLRAVLRCASWHVRLAVAIGALAPKLRLANILTLEWDVHLDSALQFITVRKHKTVGKTKRPLVIPISAQLRLVLEDARRRASGRFVVTYRGQPVKSIRGGLKAAAIAGGVPYGRFKDDGVTFHTLRHTAATMLAELDVSESKRKSVMGHQHLGTTQKYTHLRPVHELPPLEQLSAALPLTDLVTMPWTRATRKLGQNPDQKSDQPGMTAGTKSPANVQDFGASSRTARAR